MTILLSVSSKDHQTAVSEKGCKNVFERELGRTGPIALRDVVPVLVREALSLATQTCLGSLYPCLFTVCDGAGLDSTNKGHGKGSLSKP